MRTERIALSQRERDRLGVLHEVAQGHLTQVAAAGRINLCDRQVRRLLLRLHEQGDRAVIHGLRGRPSNRKLAAPFEQKIVARIRQRYADFGPTLAADKQHILNSIAAIARGLGRAPSRSEFVTLARITDYHVLQCFPSWNDAVRAAGLHPYTLNVRLEDTALLEDWGETVRKHRAIPARRAYRREGKYDPRTMERRFGPWSSLPQVFRNFAESKQEWADVVALLPAPLPKDERRRPNEDSLSSILPDKVQRVPLKDRGTYGNPIHFRGLRHEPVNEQGVVLLFGMLAKELGYLVEAVQTGSPDCEAMRQITHDRWERVHIEFEFESRNFRDHGHPSTGCDVIVCWRHNWDDCPEDIEVVELSHMIQSLTHAKD